MARTKKMPRIAIVIMSHPIFDGAHSRALGTGTQRERGDVSGLPKRGDGPHAMPSGKRVARKEEDVTTEPQRTQRRMMARCAGGSRRSSVFERRTPCPAGTIGKSRRDPAGLPPSAPNPQGMLPPKEGD